MKGIVLFSLFGLLSCLTIVNPFWGAINYIYMYHVNPSRLTGMFAGQSFITIITLLLGLGIAVNLNKISSIRLWEHAQLILTIILLMLSYILSFSALYTPETALKNTNEFGKILLTTYLMLKVIRTEKQLHLFLTGLTSLIGYVAFMRYFGPKLGLIGGPEQVVTMAGLSISIHSELAVFIGVSLVCLVSAKNIKERIFFLGLLVFQVNFMFVGYRRTPVLDLMLIVFFYVITGKPSKILRNVIICCLFVVMALGVADKKALMRTDETLSRVENEETADSRVFVWSGALKTVSDYPLGIGLGNFFHHSKYVIPREYIMGNLRGKSVEGIVTHNTYLQVLTELGFTGIALYLGIIFFTWRALNRLRKKFHASDVKSDNRIYLWGWGLEIGFLALCGDIFLRNRFDFEPFWWVVALSAALTHFDRQRMYVRNRQTMAQA